MKFDDGRAIANAGLALFGVLSEKLGLEQLGGKRGSTTGIIESIPLLKVVRESAIK